MLESPRAEEGRVPFARARALAGLRHRTRDRLLAPVQAYLDRCVPERAASPHAVRIRQEGGMWKTAGGRPQRFTATQELAVDRVEFTWQARFPITGPLAVHVTDAYADGAGQLSVRLLGYPIVRRTGPAITVGEALRYLAELPLVPDAMDSNRQLRWRDLEAAAVEVSTVVHGRRLAVRFDFDESGDLVRASTGARPHDREGGFDLVSWAGEYSRYAVLGDVRMPTATTAYWDLPEGRFVYWSGTVIAAETLVGGPMRA